MVIFQVLLIIYSPNVSVSKYFFNILLTKKNPQVFLYSFKRKRFQIINQWNSFYKRLIFALIFYSEFEIKNKFKGSVLNLNQIDFYIIFGLKYLY